MKRWLLELLACPACGGGLDLTDMREAGGEVEDGMLPCPACRACYPIVDHVPRFVAAENYAGSFGFQWNRFRRTQLDRQSGQPISRERFFRQTGWPPGELAGRLVLDVGCGVGRFAEVALACGARVVAVDYSTAVDACRQNFDGEPRLDIVQADVYRLPFKPGRFDFVYCFGVLQHTPDVRAAFMALPPQLGEHGWLAVDVYPKGVRSLLAPKYWLRPLTKRIPPPRLFPVVEKGVALLWPVSLAIGRLPWIGRTLRQAVPVANYDGVYALPPEKLREWAVLDTFDMLAPAHDQPQTARTLREWFAAAGLREVEVFRAGVLVGRGVR